MKITFRKGKINYYRHNFNWKTSPDLKIVCEELKEVKKEDFAEQVVPEIKSKFEEENDTLEDKTYKEEFYIENNERKKELKSKMENYIKEVIFDEKKAMKDEENKNLLI